MKPTKHTTAVAYDLLEVPRLGFTFFVVNKDLPSTMQIMKKAHETITNMFSDHYRLSTNTTYLNYGFLTVLEEGQSLVRYAQEMEDYEYTLRSDDEDLSSFLDAHPCSQFPHLDVLRFNSKENVPPVLKPFFDGVEEEEEIKKAITSTVFWDGKRDELIERLKKEEDFIQVEHDFSWDAWGYVDTIEVHTRDFTFSIYEFGETIRVFKTKGVYTYSSEIDLDPLHPTFKRLKNIIQGVKNG